MSTLSMKTRRGVDQSVKKERNSNLELYRIVVMLLIVAHHFVANSGLLSEGGPIFRDPFSAKSIFLLIFGAWGKTGINCFVLITGYFMCESHITLKKFLKLVLEVYFYKIVIFLVFLIAGYETVSISRIIELTMPTTSLTNNFTGCFLVLYLTIPFLNILIHNMSEKMHRNLLILVGIVFVGLGSTPVFTISFSYVAWFIALYFIASFIRLYPKNLYNNTRLWGFATLVSFTMSIVSIPMMTWVGTKISAFGHGSYFLLSDANKVLAVMTSISSFLFFKNLKIRQSKVINAISASTFGVLLIHANSDAMRTWLWKDFVNSIGAYDSKWLYVYAIAAAISIFIVCALIDMLRIRLIEKPFFGFLEKRGIVK